MSISATHDVVLDNLATRGLDALLDAAEDRRFKPLGQRGSTAAVAVAAPAPQV